MSTTLVGPAWDPGQYLKFGDHRGRPFVELLAAIPADASAARNVVDLGCGPGHLMGLLRGRFPVARLIGVDSSADMVDKARAATADMTEVEVIEGEVESWRPDASELPVDVVVSNALFQWVPGHEQLLGEIVSWLADDGVVALQVPGNFDCPSHVIAHELAASAKWADRLEGVGWPAAPGPIEYLDVLMPLCAAVDTWETTYSMVLLGDDPVLEWMKGTTLRPVLTRLDSTEAEEFCDDLREPLRAAYPARPWGTVFPFRRTFAVACQPRR